MITAAIEERARGNFAQLQLFTPDRAAGAFYEALGFDAVEGITKVSHVKVLSE